MSDQEIGDGSATDVSRHRRQLVEGSPDGRPHHIGLGRRHRGKPIVLFVADRAIRIVDADGELLREFVLDPTRNYQRQSA